MNLKKYPKIIIMALAALAASGCEDDYCVDWYPVDVNFYVQDPYGNDCLEPLSNSYIGELLRLTYLGEDYMYNPDTKFYMPEFSGLTITKNRATGKYMASFGELDGAKDYDEDFIITFPDGSRRKIHYDRTVNHTSVKAEEQWYLDGEKVETPITITYSPSLIY